MSEFKRLPGESYLDYIWRNFGGKTVQGESNIILSDDAVGKLINVNLDDREEKILNAVDNKIDKNVADQIQEKIVGDDSGTIIINVDEGKITANVKIDESESPVKLSVSENGVKASLEIDTDSSVELSTSSGKLKADVPLQGTNVPITFEKISSEDYQLLKDKQLGRLYIMTDAPFFYLDEKVYGVDLKATDGFITSIRYDNTKIYYKVSGQEEEKSITITDASETSSGLLNSEDYKSLHKVIEAIAEIEDVEGFVNDKIDTITLIKEDNTISLNAGEKVLGSIDLPLDNYVTDCKVKQLEDYELEEVKFSNPNTPLKVGEYVLKMLFNDKSSLYIPVDDLILNSSLNTFEDSATITFTPTQNKATTADVNVSANENNRLSVTTDGLLVDLTFELQGNILIIKGADKETPLYQFDIINEDSISSESGNRLAFDTLGLLTSRLDWNDNKSTPISFAKGNGSNYDVENNNQLYFNTATSELYLGENCFSLTENQKELINSLSQDAVTKIEYDKENVKFTITKADGTSSDLDFPLVIASSNGEGGNPGLMSAEQAEQLSKVKIYTAGDGIDVGTSNEINIKLNNKEQILDFDEFGNLKSQLKLFYNSKEQTIELLGKNDEVIGEGIDASDFIKDGMITSVEYTTQKPISDTAYEQGRYLKIVWNIDTNGDKENDVVYVDLEDLINAYKGGDGINIDFDTISLKLSQDDETKEYLVISDGFLKLQGVNSKFDDINLTINGIDESGQIKSTYNPSNSIADDIAEIKKHINWDDKVITDVLVNGESVVENEVANIDLSVGNVIYSKDEKNNLIMLDEKLNLIDNEISYNSGWEELS